MRQTTIIDRLELDLPIAEPLRESHRSCAESRLGTGGGGCSQPKSDFVFNKSHRFPRIGAEVCDEL